MEKVTEMLQQVATKMGKLIPINDKEIENVDLQHLIEQQAKIQDKPILTEKQAAKAQKMERMRAKVMTVARMSKIFKTLR